MVTRCTEVEFLDEFRMAIIPSRFGVTELTVFDTLIPQDRPGNLQRLRLPREFLEWTAKIHVDHDRLLGTPNSGEPLIADPVQEVIVLEFAEGWETPVFLAVRTQALIKRVCSMGADSYVPWDEWGNGAVVMEVSPPGGDPHVFVHGAQVVVWMHSAGGWGISEQCNVQALNLSWRGRNSLPVWNEGDGTGKRALLKDDGCSLFELGSGLGSLDELRLLSDGSLFYLVSRLSQCAGSGRRPMIW